MAANCSGVEQTRLRRDRRVELLPGHRGRPADCPAETCAFCAWMRLLTSRGVSRDRGELVGIEPDAHGVLRAEDLDVADAGTR
jgi:hypothetical protein